MLEVFQGYNMSHARCDHSGIDQTRIYPRVATPVSIRTQRDEEIGERSLLWDLLMRQTGAKLYINKGEMV